MAILWGVNIHRCQMVSSGQVSIANGDSLGSVRLEISYLFISFNREWRFFWSYWRMFKAVERLLPFQSRNGDSLGVTAPMETASLSSVALNREWRFFGSH
ncbi:MAG: hypothetical protein H6656_19090 [Ardenticatenaceae bacterium]|nr:hypothetical protein [Ardenticatenaceae bacterium]